MNYKDNILKRLKTINEQLSSCIIEKISESERTDICLMCGKKKNTIKMRRQNTQYTDQNSNYIESCKECFYEKEEYWVVDFKNYFYKEKT